jgi:hypothetical protein
MLGAYFGVTHHFLNATVKEIIKTQFNFAEF